MTDNPFVAAQTYLAEHGWTQGTKENKRGQVCLYGALCYGVLATDPHLIGWPDLLNLIYHIPTLTEAARELYPGVFADPSMHVFRLNDQVLTSQDQALEILERAAKLWEQKQAEPACLS